MRFVYDIKTFQKRKLQDSIAFPLEIDMGKYMQEFDERYSLSTPSVVIASPRVESHLFSSAFLLLSALFASCSSTPEAHHRLLPLNPADRMKLRIRGEERDRPTNWSVY
jgi:hypothetical protein